MSIGKTCFSLQGSPTGEVRVRSSPDTSLLIAHVGKNRIGSLFLHPHCGIASQEISGRHVHYPVSKRS